MNLTKTELKAALQAKVDADTDTSAKYTVGDGLEFVCKLEDLLEAEAIAGADQALYYGSITAAGAAGGFAEAIAIANAKMTQLPTAPKKVAAQLIASSGRSTQAHEVAFSYIEGSNLQGVFSGYKFAITTVYSLLENGTPELDEENNPVIAP
jgi:hypothetical protein